MGELQVLRWVTDLKGWNAFPFPLRRVDRFIALSGLPNHENEDGDGYEHSKEQKLNARQSHKRQKRAAPRDKGKKVPAGSHGRESTALTDAMNNRSNRSSQ